MEWLKLLEIAIKLGELAWKVFLWASDKARGRRMQLPSPQHPDSPEQATEPAEGPETQRGGAKSA